MGRKTPTVRRPAGPRDWAPPGGPVPGRTAARLFFDRLGRVTSDVIEADGGLGAGRFTGRQLAARAHLPGARSGLPDAGAVDPMRAGARVGGYVRQNGSARLTGPQMRRACRALPAGVPAADRRATVLEVAGAEWRAVLAERAKAAARAETARSAPAGAEVAR